jgi:hypothetical protein
MNIEKLRKSDLIKISLFYNVKGYSKLNKNQIVEKLLANNVPDTVTEQELKDMRVELNAREAKEAEETAKKPPKPRFKKLSKKLLESVELDNYKEMLRKFTEVSIEKDTTTLFKDDIEKFIKSKDLTHEDYKKYVDSYGAIKAVVEYMASKEDASLKKMSEKKIYKTLAAFIYQNDKTVTDELVSKVKKVVAQLNKPITTKRGGKSKSASKDKADENEEEEEDDEAASNAIDVDDEEDEEDDNE